MQTITTIGLDIAKSVFQVHGVDAQGNVTLRRQLKRRYVLTFFQKMCIRDRISAKPMKVAKKAQMKPVGLFLGISMSV